MTEKSLHFRLKSRDGQLRLDGLSTQSTICNLLEKVHNVTHISIESIKLLHGFPPKPVDLSKTSQKLADFPFMSGDIFIVEEKKVEVKTKCSSLASDPCKGDAKEAYRDRGIVTRKVVPADNSCLFRSVALLMEGGQTDDNRVGELRELIAHEVTTNPDTYTEAVLGKTNYEYCLWIRHPESWGGAIELAILSDFYATGINVVDTQSLRVDRFGEEKNHKHVIFLIYDNIHYDPLVLEVSGSDNVETVFSSDDDWMMAKAMEVAEEARRSRQYTDLSGFTLRCLVCQLGLRGQRQAQQHAMATGHSNFAEF